MTAPDVIFQEIYRELRPRAPLPEFQVEYFPFANVNNTIRLRQGRVLARISDLLQGAPESVLRSLAHILLAKLYRKPIEKWHAARYRRHISSRRISERALALRQSRGRKRITSVQGRVRDLNQVFDQLNQTYFHGLLGRPVMTWGARALTSLGHYDPAHNVIVISRVFDDERVPAFVLEYLVYHEMLHLRHPVKLCGSRRAVHPPAFQAEERLFPRFEEAKAFLKTL